MLFLLSWFIFMCVFYALYKRMHTSRVSKQGDDHAGFILEKGVFCGVESRTPHCSYRRTCGFRHFCLLVTCSCAAGLGWMHFPGQRDVEEIWHL